MDDSHKLISQTAEAKNVLPDVVHSQQIPAVGDVVRDETETVDIASGQSLGSENPRHDVGDSTETESISEHVPSGAKDSNNSINAIQSHEYQELFKIDQKRSVNPLCNSSLSDNASIQDPGKYSLSWPSDVNPTSDMHHISEESPVNLAVSTDFSRECGPQEAKSNSLESPQSSGHETSLDSPKDDKYDDSLNDDLKQEVPMEEDQTNRSSTSLEMNNASLEHVSSGSEEIIKLDIRGQGVPKLPLPTAKIIFGPPPVGSAVMDPSIDPIPVFPNLLSPFLVGAGDNLKIEEVFDFCEQKSKEPSPEKSPEVSFNKQTLMSDKIEQNDLLVEEVTVNHETKEKENFHQNDFFPSQTNPIQKEDTSMSTLTTDYKTICEEYCEKLVHMEDAITQRDEQIKELTVSLQRSFREQDNLRSENEHLTNEVQNLQHIIGEMSHSDHDTVKAQLSDFVKYQGMIKDDSTKFYSALMSEGSSLQSSNGEKDMDHEEITVNYSKSDLRSSGSSEEFQTGLEAKLIMVMNKFDKYIEENLRNKLRECLTQVICDEIGKIRIESDTEIKELEAQIQQNKQAYTGEIRRIRELLSSVKAGSADIEALRQELSVKHEKEMENLRTYFEKKCSDMERSYSEEVWRGRTCASPLGSAGSWAEPDAGGDCARRRARSAEPPSLSLESTPLEQALKQTCRKYEQQLEDLRAEQVACVNELKTRHAQTVASLEEEIRHLKVHIQTSENTEANVSLYQQDIDLELEKQRVQAEVERRVDAVRQEVIQQLQEKIQVLLSDPDAEVSSWPVELVALRDKIHGETSKGQQEKEFSSLREELLGGEDKWRQRRNHSFDQNRHLEEVTKERDGLKLVAASLQRAVAQLAAYCASAEDELNRTVLSQLLARLLNQDDTLGEEDSRPTTPNLSTEINLSTSLVSRNKHVHFAPDLNSILAELDEEGVVGFLQEQRDLSADIKRELEHSLRRLRHEAQELLELSSRLANKNRNESKMLESNSIQITELVQELDMQQKSCDNCEIHKKTMEEAMAECLQRENLLRSDLEAAMVKIAQLMAAGDGPPSVDLIAEGYGTGVASSQACYSRPRQSSGTASPPEHAAAESPRARLQLDYDALQRERDDLHQQLEAANRQLRATRQFVEEQAAEREAERDEFARSLADLRQENTRLAARLQANARILAEVEQLEAQTREMNQIINELETRKASAHDQLKATEEKISLLRDIIANLESQLEQKTAREAEILEQLEQMKKTIDDRDGKMRSLLGELESLKSEKGDQTDVTCVKCSQEEDKYGELIENIKEQCRVLENKLHRRTQQLERAHEVCSAPCSEPSEDVSLRDHRDIHLQVRSPEAGESEETGRVGLVELAGVWECILAQWRAEDAALKRIADLEMQRNHLKDVAQEVRAERDVLQARMSEQALKISSLSARLTQQRNDAEALAHHAASQLSVQLHDALAEVQRLKEELESKDKQLARVKQNLEERDKLNEQHHSLYGNSCNPKDKVIILERELSSAQNRIAQLESLARSLETDKERLQASVRELQRALAEREDQLQELMALKLEDDNQKEEKSEVIDGKVSARTLSDIVSISEFDEQDLQMRRAELKAQNLNISGAPYVTETKVGLQRTLPPDVSSLNIEYIDQFDAQLSPRADSLPAHLTSTQNKDSLKHYKRNINETTILGTDKFVDSVKHSTAQNIPDNCSMFPNRNVSESLNVSVEPKKINFSMEPSADNRIQEEEEFTSLRELGITLDIKQENFPDILTQLKHEIKKSKTELEKCKSELKNAEEQLCEFPALKEEVEELKGLLENTMATMETDKKFYENQLENFSSNKKLLEQRVSELSQEVNDKSKDLHLLKEDILRRENMILELAKEKRNLTNKLAELEVKIDEVKSRNSSLEKSESENHQLREKINELQKLEQLVSEKNQQIDSLNQHLDRFDDLQRCLNDKTEEFENLKEAFEEKSSEVFQLQNSIEALNRDLNKVSEENEHLNTSNKELKLKLTKLEKEQENASIKLQKSESELERVNSLNEELTSKIEELKLLTDKLKDKETEIEILNEDINTFHEEVSSLKEQLKMASRSPSPRSGRGGSGALGGGGDARVATARTPAAYKKQLAKIRKQISLLQHELDFNKKELNDKAFELAKAKLDVTELRNNLSQATKQSADKEAANSELSQLNNNLQRQLEELALEKQHLTEQLNMLAARVREELNISELKTKLQEKVERCQELENELENMREIMGRRVSDPRSECGREVAVAGARSPTAELERALRDQLHYSHTLDDDIMEQILSASSDEREDVPRLALNISKSSSSIHSSSSDRVGRLRAENEKLQLQVNNLESRIRDKDALIAELNRVRDKLSQEVETSALRAAAEREHSARLQLLLDTHKDTAESLQHQDTNMIQILKKRLESSMQSELELQARVQHANARAAQLERQLLAAQTDDSARRSLQQEMENTERLNGEISLLKSKLEVERNRYGDLQALLDHSRAQAQRELDQRGELCAALKVELAEAKRLKHECSVELVRAKELLNTQSDTIAQLERKLAAASPRRARVADALTEIENHKTELSRELATLKKCLVECSGPELTALRAERAQLADTVRTLQRQLQAQQEQQQRPQPEDRDQAMRYLQWQCMQLKSYRKALVWQKRYLQYSLAGYGELERRLRLPATSPANTSTGKKRFKCVVWSVCAVVRMAYLVRRRAALRVIAAQALHTHPQPTPSECASNSPPSRDRSDAMPSVRVERVEHAMPRHITHADADRVDNLARPVPKQDVCLNIPPPASLVGGEFVRRSPYKTNSPRGDSFILSSSRGEVASAYLTKLELVSRSLNQVMDAPRDVP